MADAARLHLAISLELDDDTIRGTVHDGVGPVVEFTGWLELMSAFDTARARAGGGEPGEPGSARSGLDRDR